MTLRPAFLIATADHGAGRPIRRPCRGV